MDHTNNQRQPQQSQTHSGIFVYHYYFVFVGNQGEKITIVKWYQSGKKLEMVVGLYDFWPIVPTPRLKSGLGYGLELDNNIQQTST